MTPAKDGYYWAHFKDKIDPEPVEVEVDRFGDIQAMRIGEDWYREGKLFRFIAEIPAPQIP